MKKKLLKESLKSKNLFVTNVILKKEELVDPLDKPLRVIIEDIDNSFKEAFHAVRKGEDIWDLWAMKWIPLKVSLEIYLKQHLMFVPVLIYCYWHNRNELLQAYIKSSIGNVSLKKQVYQSGRNMKEIIKGKAFEKNQESVMKNNVSRHLLELKEGCYEPIAGRKVITKIEEEENLKAAKEREKTRTTSKTSPTGTIQT